jgi:hypothetical protein
MSKNKMREKQEDGSYRDTLEKMECGSDRHRTVSNGRLWNQ